MCLTVEYLTYRIVLSVYRRESNRISPERDWFVDKTSSAFLGCGASQASLLREFLQEIKLALRVLWCDTATINHFSLAPNGNGAFLLSSYWIRRWREASQRFVDETTSATVFAGVQ
jgi:hypothetical protein